jgi:hypothetical protein
MKRIAGMLTVLCALVSLPAVYASTAKHRSTSHHSSASRPYYGGGKHTTSHGGQYPGAINSHHRNGHYQNWRSANRYGVHKPV